MIKRFGKQWIILILILISLISYGQILGMNFWQDDNAVVFKFTHIDEDAGYLGKGVFGEGAYRYTVASYLPIFYIFGYEPLPYFAFALAFFIASALAVYFFFLIVFEDRIKAALAGFLYSAGYIASDGFIRMFNSVLTSLSVILVCSTIGAYFRFFKTKNILWYFAGLLSYFLAIEIGYIRTHFLIVVIISFELFFFLGNKITSPQKFLKDLGVSIIRLIPFGFLFYQWFIVNADSRSNQIFVLVGSIYRGEFYKAYSFFTSLGNMLLSNEVFPPLYSLVQNLSGQQLSNKNIAAVFILIFLSLVFILFVKKIINFGQAFLYGFITSVLLVSAFKIFNNPGLIGGINEKVSLYFGIFFILAIPLLFTILPAKKISLLFIVWMVANLFAYGAYIPIYAYPSDNRYLLQSFIPLVGLLSLWSFDFFKKYRLNKIAYLPLFLVILWGSVNLYSSLSWQNKIILHRSEPSKRFFSQLKNYVPSFPKGSIFYFYVPDKPLAHPHFDSSFGVAQMPDQTAIAWRYGVDRYDLTMVTSFSELEQKLVKDNIPIEKIYAFVADTDQLIDVTKDMRVLLQNGFAKTEALNKLSGFNIYDGQRKIILEPIKIFPNNVSLLTPLQIEMKIKGTPLLKAEFNFPLQLQSNEPNGAIEDNFKRQLYLDYFNWKDDYYKDVTIKATTSWKDFTANLLIDSDHKTYWQADRLEWGKGPQGFTVDLGKTMEIAGILYREGPVESKPTQILIEVSKDNNSFEIVKYTKVENSSAIDEIKKISFPVVSGRYVKVTFQNTLYQESPAVSEVEVIPKSFQDIDPMEAQRFLRQPFSYVQSKNDWNNLISGFLNYGLVRVSWKDNLSPKMKTEPKTTFIMPYNSIEQKVILTLPGGGRKLEEIEIMPINIPGVLSISGITYKNLPL